MVIYINGERKGLEAEETLAHLIERLGLPEASVVVERNGEIISRDKRHLVTLREGDVLEIVRLVGGG